MADVVTLCNAFELGLVFSMRVHSQNLILSHSPDWPDSAYNEQLDYITEICPGIN